MRQIISSLCCFLTSLRIRGPYSQDMGRWTLSDSYSPLDHVSKSGAAMTTISVGLEEVKQYIKGVVAIFSEPQIRLYDFTSVITLIRQVGKII